MTDKKVKSYCVFKWLHLYTCFFSSLFDIIFFLFLFLPLWMLSKFFCLVIITKSWFAHSLIFKVTPLNVCFYGYITDSPSGSCPFCSSQDALPTRPLVIAISHELLHYYSVPVYWICLFSLIQSHFIGLYP